MEDAELPFDAPIIAGEAVEMRQNGLLSQRSFEALFGGGLLEAIQAEKPQVLNSDAIHEEFFRRSLRIVISVESAAHLSEDGAFVAGERREK